MSIFLEKSLTVPHEEGHEIAVFNFNAITPPEQSIEKEAEKNGWIKKIGNGQYILKKEMAALFISFQELFRDVSKKMNYEEWIFPRLQTKEVIKNFGWLDIENLRPELFTVQQFEDDGQRIHDEWFLDPLQCPSFYRYLKESSPLILENLPIKVHEWRGGWTYRNEKATRLQSGFGTSLEFSGLELVFAGTLEQVKAIRFETMIEILNALESMQLNFRLVVGSSCSHKKNEGIPGGELISLYDISTLDIEVEVPQENGYIEIGGADFIGERLVRNFGITSKDGTQIYSGCQGVGWQRLAKAFLSQKGFDSKNWPLCIKNNYNC